MGQPDTLVAGNMMGKSCAHLPGCVMQFGVRNEPLDTPGMAPLPSCTGGQVPLFLGGRCWSSAWQLCMPQGSLSSSSELTLEQERSEQTDL